MQLKPPSPTQAVIRDDQNERIGWFLSLTGDGTRRPTLVVAAVLTPVPEPIVSLTMRLMWGDQCIAEKPVWFAKFATTDDAAVRYDWLIEHPQELEFWACQAEMRAPDALLQLIEEGIQLRQLERQEAEHAAQEEADQAAQLATGAAALLDELPKAQQLLGDRGYDADWFRDALQAKGIQPCIPGRKSRLEPIRYDKRRYRRRSRIEIMFGRLKDWRRVATRYDRCPTVSLSVIALAATVIFWL